MLCVFRYMGGVNGGVGSACVCRYVCGMYVVCVFVCACVCDLSGVCVHVSAWCGCVHMYVWCMCRHLCVVCLTNHKINSENSRNNSVTTETCSLCSGEAQSLSA